MVTYRDFNRSIIIDPDRDGCTIWTGNYVSRIKGNLQEVCKSIFNRVTVEKEDLKGNPYIEQVINIGINIAGIGRAYACEIDSLELSYFVIKARKIDLVLPELR